MEKFQIFYQNHGLTPLEKSLFFEFFNFLILESKNAFFSFQNIVKQIFLSDFAKNKKKEKFQIFDKNHGPTPLEKSPFFYFFFLILIFIVLKHFFPFQNNYGRTHFPGLFFFKKRWKKFKFLTKTMGQPLWKNTKFSTFLTLQFQSLKTPFYFLE